MKIFILLNAILEISVGVLMIFAPHLIPGIDANNIMEITLARMYGAAAMTVGIYALKVWKTMLSKPQINSCLQLLSIFHIGVANAAFTGFNRGLSDFLLVFILHMVLFLGAIFFWWRNKS